MKEIYHQKVPWVIVVMLISSSIACYRLYVSYWNSNAFVHFILANFFLLVTIVFMKPIITWRRIEIDDDDIVLFMNFYKPKRFDISESLFQVVIHTQDVYSFRFKHGVYYTQISPMIYRNGINLSKRLTDHIKKHDLQVNILS